MLPTDTQLLNRFKSGDKDAANELIGRYFDRVLRLAEKHLANRRLHVTEGDDVAASVFETLWKKADANRFGPDDLVNSEELWRLLCKIVAFKSRDHVRRESAQKRGGNLLKGESFFMDSMGSQPYGIQNVSDGQIPVGDVLILREEHDRLLDKLDDDTLVQIAMMRLEGYKIAEIANSFSKTERWVGRKLRLIRTIWRHDLDQMTQE